ncbi:hypothetical protein FOA52_000441 [Chlamydomonas sp. UWO 241]|nr:hypothetical protein FOA52_000441 [Chlamydomonas sp. UWO 241]
MTGERSHEIIQQVELFVTRMHASLEAGRPEPGDREIMDEIAPIMEPGFQIPDNPNQDKIEWRLDVEDLWKLDTAMDKVYSPGKTPARVPEHRPASTASEPASHDDSLASERCDAILLPPLPPLSAHGELPDRATLAAAMSAVPAVALPHRPLGPPTHFDPRDVASAPKLGQQLKALGRHYGWSQRAYTAQYSAQSRYPDLIVYYDAGEQDQAVNELASAAFPQHRLSRCDTTRHVEMHGSVIVQRSPELAVLRSPMPIDQAEHDADVAARLAKVADTLLWFAAADAVEMCHLRHAYMWRHFTDNLMTSATTEEVRSGVAAPASEVDDVSGPMKGFGRGRLDFTDANIRQCEDACDCCGRVRPLAPKLIACSGCKTSFYCGRACQKKHWKHHKAVCEAHVRAAQMT